MNELRRGVFKPPVRCAHLMRRMEEDGGDDGGFPALRWLQGPAGIPREAGEEFSPGRIARAEGACSYRDFILLIKRPAGAGG